MPSNDLKGYTPTHPKKRPPYQPRLLRLRSEEMDPCWASFSAREHAFDRVNYHPMRRHLRFKQQCNALRAFQRAQPPQIINRKWDPPVSKITPHLRAKGQRNTKCTIYSISFLHRGHIGSVPHLRLHKFSLEASVNTHF